MKASEILADCGMKLGTASRAKVIQADRLAEQGGGTIQARDAEKLFGLSDPTRWTCMDLDRALLLLGCERVERK